MIEKYTEQQALDEAAEMEKLIEKGQAKDYSEAEKIIENCEPTPLDKIIPGIDLTGMPSIEEAVEKNRTGATIEGYPTAPFGRGVPTNYSDLLADALLDSRSALQLGEALKDFNGQIIVDLGAGKYPLGYHVANRTGAKAYVAVEPFWPDEAKKALLTDKKFLNRNKDDSYPKIENIGIAPEDMLTFLQRLPDNSVSILMSGIDSAIIGGGRGKELVDTKLLEKQIQRVLDPKGILVIHESILHPAEGFDVTFVKTPATPTIRVYKKK